MAKPDDARIEVAVLAMKHVLALEIDSRAPVSG